MYLPRVMGTYGYAAPEYVMTGHSYFKEVTLYSFGVGSVLLEMLCLDGDPWIKNYTMENITMVECITPTSW
ncbi:unnamed protein product [Rhodiola kirilowii]